MDICTKNLEKRMGGQAMCSRIRFSDSLLVGYACKFEEKA